MNLELSPEKLTILVVDDNPTNIQVLFDVLHASGYQISVAKTGESALQRLENHLADLILLDVMMPGIDGFETCRRLKQSDRTRDIPVIFMTALSDTVDKVKGLSLGAVDYITKPIQHEEVLARIRVHLQLRHLNKTLEEQVAQRTAELQQTLDSLQHAQVQLVQSEKMSSLGQLVAGVAHEINNPVNFIYGNLTPASEYISDLLHVMGLYRTHYPEPVSEIQGAIEEVDLDFLNEDLPKLLKSMKIGADRIQKIVASLRTFSRMDEADVKPVNLHDGIESTLMILNNRVKVRPERPAINIVKDYGDLPPVECYAGQMNQVFMNLLSNALDAIDEWNSQRNPAAVQQDPGQICIRTRLVDDDQVRIQITDTGPGIPPEIQPKLFDPFFTTKPVGKGTGMGLSISYQIITEKHQGRLYCQSSLGQGTEFTIQIPLSPHATSRTNYFEKTPVCP
jgi:signal transduction histidine kinase